MTDKLIALQRTKRKGKLRILKASIKRGKERLKRQEAALAATEDGPEKVRLKQRVYFTKRRLNEAQGLIEYYSKPMPTSQQEQIYIDVARAMTRAWNQERRRLLDGWPEPLNSQPRQQLEQFLKEVYLRGGIAAADSYNRVIKKQVAAKRKQLN